MPPLVRDLIEAARIRHWSFTDIELGDGAVLLYLNQRQRTHLAAFGAAVEGIVGASVQYDLVIEDDTNALISMVGGVPTFIDTVADGYAFHLDAQGVPYFSTDDTPVAKDPFGSSGGTPGWPLPTDMLRLIGVTAVYGDNARNIPVDLIPERGRATHLPGRNPAVFVSGNRLVPLFPYNTAPTSDRWLAVTALQISYVPLTTLTALTDPVTLPAVLCEALTADLALLLARQSQSCPAADKAGFERDAKACIAAIAAASLDLLESVQSSSVLFQR